MHSTCHNIHGKIKISIFIYDPNPVDTCSTRTVYLQTAVGVCTVYTHTPLAQLTTLDQLHAVQSITSRFSRVQLLDHDGSVLVLYFWEPKKQFSSKFIIYTL
jgi:hypothetical protein